MQENPYPEALEAIPSAPFEGLALHFTPGSPCEFRLLNDGDQAFTTDGDLITKLRHDGPTNAAIIGTQGRSHYRVPPGDIVYRATLTAGSRIG